MLEKPTNFEELCELNRKIDNEESLLEPLESLSNEELSKLFQRFNEEERSELIKLFGALQGEPGDLGSRQGAHSSRAGLASQALQAVFGSRRAAAGHMYQAGTPAWFHAFHLAQTAAASLRRLHGSRQPVAELTTVQRDSLSVFFS